MAIRKWLGPPSEELDRLVKLYSKNLHDIATRLADQCQLQRVDIKHVTQAHEALAAVGLSLIPWYKKPQLKTSIGGTLFGSGFSAISLVPLFGLPQDLVNPVSWGVFVVCLSMGLVFMVWGWLGGMP